MRPDDPPCARRRAERRSFFQMDPDGLVSLIANSSRLARLVAAYRAGAVVHKRNREGRAASLGFSDRMAGLFARHLCLRADFVYGFFAFCTGPWWTLLRLGKRPRWPCCCTALAAKGRIKEKSGFTAACGVSAAGSPRSWCQGAGASGPVRRNRGGCALRGRRGGARSDRRKPEEDDHPTSSSWTT